ncbi:MAG: amidohydrolase [Saprospiraceae bacterium]|nr:amidohydrolase [Saprospiraceae bacterium]MBP6567781.1 amidohydrolase [Saprospiraceae bacterium]
MQIKIFLCAITLLSVWGCQSDEMADLVIYNANIYAVDTTYQEATSIAIKDGLILKIGSESDIEKLSDENTERINADGKFVMPGFIEGHGHYSGLGYSLINLNFLQSKSWEDIVDAVAKRATEVKPGQWIIGRGWHQEKWDSIPKQNMYNYPFHYTLSDVSPDNPVLLYHASGHSVYANKKAMDLAGITKETSNPVGGEIVRNSDGDAIGVFEERAMGVFKNKYQEYLASLDKDQLDSIWYSAIQLAEKECISKGITSFQDAGSSFEELDKYEKLALDGNMKVRLWAMARHPANELEGKVGKYKKINVGNRFYTCNAIKSEVDGALGAFGAWLLEPYSDKPGFKGQNTTDIYDVKKIADMAITNDMQFCVHAIGDRANRVVLDIYEGVIGQHPDKKDIRWRIEHAQHLSPDDIPRFAKNKIIASMQGIHCTSDAPFVVKRLGTDRSRLGAYAWRSLLDNGVIVANGTDAPVEDVDPIKSFYASVTRRREDSGLVFFSEQKMTREEAIYSYTLGNAFAAFEDEYKGSLRAGKVADLVILSNDLVKCTDDEILKTKVLYTITDGKVRFKAE